MRRIFVFGDSIAFGRGVKRDDNWVSKISVFFDGEFSKENIVFNLSIPSETSTDLDARFEKELIARIKSKEPEDYNIIIIATGINDSKVKLKKPRVAKDRFVENIREIIDVAEKHADKIIFVGLTRVQERKVSQFRNTLISEYNNLIRDACLDKKVTFVDIFNDWPGNSSNYYCNDGVHPNEMGHTYIAEKIINAIVALDKECIDPFRSCKAGKFEG